MQIVFLVTKMLQMYFSNMSYFVRVGAHGSLFTGTVWFCNGCQTFSCWGRTESSSSGAWFPLWIICNQSEQQAFLIVLFECVCVCVSEYYVLYVEMRQIIVVRLSVYWGSSTVSLWWTYTHVATLFILWGIIWFVFLAIIEAASPTLFGHSL